MTPVRVLLAACLLAVLPMGVACAEESKACKADLTGNGVVNFAHLAFLKSVFFQRCNDPGPICGDGVAQGPTEQCDDGNTTSWDGCSSTCAIEGWELPDVCGDGFAVAPEQCDDGNLGNGDGCSSTCQIEVPLPAVCGNGIAQGPSEQCDDGNVLSGDGCSSTCQIVPVLIADAFAATGQTTCWNSNGTAISCAGTGQDGDIQAGATIAYADNGDGTITDLNTGLMWEKLSDDGSIHDWDNLYTWPNAFAVKVATLNGGGGFAGHTDWRVPNYKELLSIVNLQNFGPAVSAAFNTGCAASCSVTTCSCTQSDFYWSSSSYPRYPSNAWHVYFDSGFVDAYDKTGNAYVRAVCGGPWLVLCSFDRSIILRGFFRVAESATRRVSR